MKILRGISAAHPSHGMEGGEIHSMKSTLLRAGGRLPATMVRGTGPTRTVGGASAPGFPVPTGAALRDRYTLIRGLGSGASSQVYLAWDRKHDREVALKLLALPGKGEARERLEREVRLVSDIAHPALVRMLDFVQLDDHSCWITEYMDGGSLRDALRERGRLPVAEAFRVLMDILEGLAFLHERGLVHRDLKPDNILLDRSGRAKIADFGLVRASADEVTPVTSAGVILGTPLYMAPEQLSADSCGPAADLYAMGVILHEMVMGRPLHLQGDIARLWEQKSRKPDLAEIRTAGLLPEPVLLLLQGLLDPDPARRPGSAQDIARVIQSPAALVPADMARARASDEDLLAQASRGDTGAFEDLVRRYQERGWRLACKFLGDSTESQDVIQTAFVRIIEKLDEGLTVRSFKAWFRCIVTRLCRDRAQKMSAVPAGGLEQVVSPVSSLGDRAARQERRQRIRQLLEKLPATQRMAVILKYDEGLSARQIAEAMETTPKSVERMLSRARQAMAEILREDIG